MPSHESLQNTFAQEETYDETSPGGATDWGSPGEAYPLADGTMPDAGVEGLYAPTDWADGDPAEAGVLQRCHAAHSAGRRDVQH